MNKHPSIIYLTQQWVNDLTTVQTSVDGKHWEFARPLGYLGFCNRVKAAWLVFTGQADALLWPPFKQQKDG